MSDTIRRRVYILTKKNNEVCPVPETLPESGISVTTRRKDLECDAKGWPEHEGVQITAAVLEFKRRKRVKGAPRT